MINCKKYKIKSLYDNNVPYFTKDTANGLAFSVNEGKPIPPSLMQINKAIENNIYDGLNLEQFPRTNGDLSYLCQQGVLLLNTALTVQEGKAESHWSLWKPFMDFTIEAIQSVQKNLIFLLWGKRAKEYQQIINPFSHFTLTETHPAGAAYSGSTWTTDNFSRTNTIISINNLGNPIQW